MPEVRFVDDIDEKMAERIALEEIRSTFGTILHPGRPVRKDDSWIVPVEFSYPRVLFDESRQKPRRVRFMEPQQAGEIIISVTDRSIISKPRYFDVRNAIRDRLHVIRDVVEKILVKVGAENFSRLPFPTHMHTPVVDILSWLFTNDVLDLSQLFKQITEDDQHKYMQSVASLQDVGLIIEEASMVRPSDLLIEIESRRARLSENLSQALTIFFERGFGMLDSIRQVLGPHLTISGICYQESMEYGGIIPFSFEKIESRMLEFYPRRVRIKIPRYLAQLEEIGLLEEQTAGGQLVWTGKETILDNMFAERELLEPVASYLGEEPGS